MVGWDRGDFALAIGVAGGDPVAERAVKQPENRLTPEEIAYQKEGDSAEIVEWNRQFGLLIAEYLEAVECEDEGWIGERVHEVRKVLGGLDQPSCQLSDISKCVNSRHKLS